MTATVAIDERRTGPWPRAFPPGVSADLAYGQGVIATARWVLITSGLIIALWNPESATQFRVQIATTLALAALNFYLHAQLLTRRPVLDRVVYAASLGDLAVITAIVVSQGGYASNNFVFYYPAVLAFAVSFPRHVTLVFTASAAALYGLVALGTVPYSEHGTDAAIAVFLRLLTLGAVAVCGSLYWTIERRRRGDTTAEEESPTTLVEGGIS